MPIGAHRPRPTDSTMPGSSQCPSRSTAMPHACGSASRIRPPACSTQPAPDPMSSSWSGRIWWATFTPCPTVFGPACCGPVSNVTIPTRSVCALPITTTGIWPPVTPAVAGGCAPRPTAGHAPDVQLRITTATTTVVARPKPAPNGCGYGIAKSSTCSRTLSAPACATSSDPRRHRRLEPLPCASPAGKPTR